MSKSIYLNREMHRGIAVTFLNQFIKICLSLISLPILARFVPPHDFGYFAIVFALYLVLDLIRDLGISISQYGEGDSTNLQRSSFFWISCFSGVFFFAISFLLFFGLVEVLRIPNNFQLILVLNLGLVVNGFGSQFLLDLRLQLRFKALARIEFLANFFSLLAAVLVAFAHWGIWALVIQQFVLSLITSCLAFLYSEFRPERNLKICNQYMAIGKGLWMSASQVVDILSKSMLIFQLGQVLSLNDMGMYDRAQQLQNIPHNALSIPARNLSLPIMRRVKSESDRLQDVLYKIQFVLLHLMFLIYSILFVNAEIVVNILYGSEYVAALPIYKLLIIIGMIQSASLTGIWVILISKLSRSILFLSLVNMSLVLFCVQIGLHFGLLPAILGLLVANVLKMIAIFKVASSSSGLQLSRIFRQGCILLMAYIFISIVLGSITSVLSSTLSDATLFVLSSLVLLVFPVILTSLSHSFPNEGKDDFRVLVSFSRRAFQQFK